MFTLGHSNRDLPTFLALIAQHDISAVVDVRRVPASRRHPHFARESLETAITRAGVSYVWMPALGGKRQPRADSPHTAWKEPAFAGYADHMESQAFAEAVRSLSTLPAGVALMCAEAEPTHCHRQLLADWLAVHGAHVDHIVDGGAPRRHELTAFARVDEGRLVYDLGQRSLF